MRLIKKTIWLVFLAILHVVAFASSDSLFVSEVYVNTTSDEPGFIELYNKKQENVDITDWRLGLLTENIEIEEYVFPEESIIPGYGFFLIGFVDDESDWEDEIFTPDFYVELTEYFSDTGGSVMLYDDEDEYIDMVGWGDCQQGYYETEAIDMLLDGHSFERKSGPNHNEMAGNSYDTDDNGKNFRDRSNPGSQNVTSIPEKPPLNAEGQSWSYIKAMYATDPK